MLTTLVKERHNNRNSTSFTTNGSDDTLQILIVVIGGHMVLMSAEGISKRVVGYIDQKIKVCTSDRFQNGSFGFAGSETGNLCSKDVGITLIS